MTAHPRRTVLALAALLILTCASGPLAAEALALGDDPVLRRMDAVLEENARLRDEAWKARSRGKDAAKVAADAYEASEARLEKTRAEALAHVAGVSPAQVEDMRRDGKSWGQAAGELGVHPGFLGIGKVPMYEPAAVRKAARAEAIKAKRKGARGEKAVKSGRAAKPGKENDAPKAGKKSKDKAQAAAKTKGKPAADKPKKSKKKTAQ